MLVKESICCFFESRPSRCEGGAGLPHCSVKEPNADLAVGELLGWAFGFLPKPV